MDRAGFSKMADAAYTTTGFSYVGSTLYMLHREPDNEGKIDWRQISGLDKHGEYDAAITEDESLTIARETMEYEHAFLDQQIAFLDCVQEWFARHHSGTCRKPMTPECGSSVKAFQ